MHVSERVVEEAKTQRTHAHTAGDDDGVVV